ncbi:MAG: tetratricopeptide repeat protein, partial [candidate division Zixibacteria bacterium]|nr:tetratricopeptide repeat protein [candidate division Zixibacteria bacterium]
MPAKMIGTSLLHYDITAQLSQKALDSLADTSDDQLQSIALGHMGHAHFHRGDFREAVDVLSQAAVKQRAIGDQRGLAQSLNFAGLAYHRLGDFSRAIASHEESLAIKRSLNDLAVIPGGLNDLGDAYRDIGLIDEAIGQHTESLGLAREQDNIGSECDNLRDLGADFLIIAIVRTIFRLNTRCSTGASFTLSQPKCPCRLAETLAVSGVELAMLR